MKIKIYLNEEQEEQLLQIMKDTAIEFSDTAIRYCITRLFLLEHRKRPLTPFNYRTRQYRKLTAPKGKEE